MKREFISTNIWATDFDMNALYSLISDAIGILIAETKKNYLICKNAPLSAFLQKFACYCGDNGPESCRSNAKVELVSGTTSCGSTKKYTASGNTINFNGAKAERCDQAISVRVSSVPVMAGTGGSSNNTAVGLQKRDLVLRARRDGLLFKRSTNVELSADCYVQVRNAIGGFVAQLRGDCITFSTSVPVNDVQICISMKSTILSSPTYPMPAIAVKSVDANNNDLYRLSNLTATVVGSSICTFVSQSDTYCPGKEIPGN